MCDVYDVCDVCVMCDICVSLSSPSPIASNSLLLYSIDGSVPFLNSTHCNGRDTPKGREAMSNDGSPGNKTQHVTRPPATPTNGLTFGKDEIQQVPIV